MPDAIPIELAYASLQDGMEAARAAHAAEGLDAALRVLAAVRAQYPSELTPVRQAYDWLRNAGRLDEADDWLSEARDRFPQAEDLAVEHASSAHRRRDFDEALRRWERVRADFPDNPAGYVQAATSLREAGRHEAAEQAAAVALERFPHGQTAQIEHAWVAFARNDWDEAARRWHVVRRAQPDRPDSYFWQGISLRNGRRLDEADKLFFTATKKFPAAAYIFAEYAWMAAHRHDWPKALRRFALLRAKFPNELAGYVGAALALRELHQPDEADGMLAEGVALLPEDSALLREYAAMASHRRDWTEAAQRWAKVREQRPDDPGGYTSGAMAMREAGQADEAEVLLEAAAERFPDNIAIHTERAWLAHARRDWASAATRWEVVRQMAPDHQPAYASAAQASRELGRSDDVDAILAAAVARFPNEVGPSSEYAWAAARRNDWPEATRRWQETIARFPDWIGGYSGMAFVFRASGQSNDGEDFLLDAMQRFPDDPGLATDHAWIASGRGDHEAALRRFRLVCERFPQHSAAHNGLSLALRALGRIDEAEQAAADAIARFPDDGGPLISHATIASQRGDWSEALERWERVHARFPDEHSGYSGVAQALRGLRRFDEADALLRDAMRRFPQNPQMFLDFGEIATRRGDWQVALARLTDARRRFPREMSIQQALHEAQLRMAIEAPEALAASEPITMPAGEIDQEMKEIVSAFASLGGEHRGCEFGEIQRYYGAEPLDLLRWAHIPPAGLIAALECRFEGMGEPENTDVYAVQMGERWQYEIADHRFGFGTHTFVYREDAPQEKVAAQAYRRMQYLRRELIDDLESGAKIFVYRTAIGNLSDEDLNRLHAAIQGFSDTTTLLYLRYADEAHADGTVEVVRPGLMVGYLDHFGANESGTLISIRFDSWTKICRQAYQLWRSGAATAQAVPSPAEENAPVGQPAPADQEARASTTEWLRRTPAARPIPHRTDALAPTQSTQAQPPARGLWRRVKAFLSVAPTQPND